MQFDLFAAEPAETQTSSNESLAIDQPADVMIEGASALPALTKADALDLPSTAADAYERFAPGVSDHPRRAPYRSALKRLSDVLKIPLHQLPADPEQLRLLLKSAKPALAGVKPRTWSQIKSVALAALRAVGVEIAGGRDTTEISISWQPLREQLDTTGKIALSKLLRFLSRRQIAPAEFTPEAFADYRAELVSLAALINPRKACNQAARSWNRAVVAVEGWPQFLLPIEPDPRHYSLDWSAFDPRFRREVDEFLASRANDDVLADDYVRAVRPATTKGRSKHLRQAASCLVLSGNIELRDLISLRQLCTDEHARAILRVMRDKHPATVVTEGAVNVIWTLRTIAKYQLKDEKLADGLKQIVSKANRRGDERRGGMRPRNRERLRQFDLPANIDALVDLPQQTLKRLPKTGTPSHRECVRIMYGLMVGILTFVPIRSQNLIDLELGAHLSDVGKGSQRTVRIHLPASITKTSRDYDAPVPRHLYPLLDAWLTRCRHIVCSGPSPYLFPNASGAKRSRDSVASKLTAFLKRQTGLEMHLHLFRHLAAKLYLDANPHGIELVSQFLGHSSTRTTLKAYAELKTDPAFRNLEQSIFGITERAPKSDPRSRGRS